ncbi:MAG: hypothetical protein P8Y36_06970 [Alphaproteobacteria bacterium]
MGELWRIDHRCVAVEKCRPFGMGQLAAQRLEGGGVIDGDNLVVTTPIANARPVHLPRQPFPAAVGCPALYTHMHPAELGIDQIQIEVQAFAPPSDHFQAMGFTVGDHGKRAARFKYRENANQSLRHAVTFGDPLGKRFFRAAGPVRAGAGQIFDRPPSLGGKRFDVIPYPLRLALEELASVLEQNPALPQVTSKSPAPIQGSAIWLRPSGRAMKRSLAVSHDELAGRGLSLPASPSASGCVQSAICGWRSAGAWAGGVAARRYLPLRRAHPSLAASTSPLAVAAGLIELAGKPPASRISVPSRAE